MTDSSLNQGTLKRFVEKRLLFGQTLSLELTAILSVYFVQGILGLARLAVSFFLKDDLGLRSEEHTSELQSRPHISYAVFCLKKKKISNT